MEINPNFSENAKNDLRLVGRAIAGEQKAYAELMARYRDAIYFILLKMVNNRDDANDLAIETFAKAFQNLEKYKPDYAFSTWLFKIATNNCIDYIRKKKLKTFSIDQVSGEDGENSRPWEIAGNSPTPEESLIKKQKTSLLKNVVDKLPIRYRKLVILRYFEELSYEEISTQLDIPLGTVKAQLFRAHNLLLNILKHSKDTI
jgi:RNA polymerase sigma-70 factor (ECF subfamily)